MMHWIIGGVVIVALALGGFLITNNGEVPEEGAMVGEERTMQKDAAAPEAMMNDAAIQEEVLMQKEDIMMEGDSMMKDVEAKKGSYETYSAEKIAQAATGDVVLFFRAGWCPTCKVADADIRTNLSKIPSSLTILDVNYDTSVALRQKYGVTYQHTFVQVDATGTRIHKWSGSQTLSEIIAQVK